MAQKKDRSRFSIKFRENDPAHERTICILESQGQRNIAPFLVNAVLHYVQCTETPKVVHMLAENQQSLLDRDTIKDVVVQILRQQGIIKDKKQKEDIQVFVGEKANQNKKEKGPTQNISSQNLVSDDMRAMITKTLMAFKNEY